MVDEQRQERDEAARELLGAAIRILDEMLDPVVEPDERRRAHAQIQSAHVVPPIGAQGLNMGLRDAADVADIVGQALSLGEDPGSPAVLARYQSARRSDVDPAAIKVRLISARRATQAEFGQYQENL